MRQLNTLIYGYHLTSICFNAFQVMVSHNKNKVNFALVWFHTGRKRVTVAVSDALNGFYWTLLNQQSRIFKPLPKAPLFDLVIFMT